MIFLWVVCIKERATRHGKVFNIGDYKIVSSALATEVSYYLTHKII